VVTLSAAFGAGGSVVGPRVAELLEVPFVDRAIPVEVSRQLAVPLEEALARDERSEHGIGRVLTAFAHVSMGVGWAPPPNPLDEHTFRVEAERVIHARASEGAVILGRAAALVLAEHPGALHVRLDGPEAARAAQAVRIGAAEESDARKTQREADRARDAYVRHLYGADPADPRHYHLVLDSTAIGLDTCAEIVATAARAR
jgi:hypothetical protein